MGVDFEVEGYKEGFGVRVVRCGDSDDRFIDDSYFIKLYDTLFLLAPGEMFC